MSLWSRFAAFEQTYIGLPWIEFCRAHAEIPVFAVSGYLMLVFYLPKVLENRKGFTLRKSFAAWNLLLSLFSLIGTTRTVPVLIEKVLEKGIDHTLCANPMSWYSDGPVGLWMALFIYSKIPELLDTLFLVLQKKRVIFLGWFHHTTVLLYCWHAYHNTIAAGLWFAGMNFSVHTVMYMYYFLMVFPTTRASAKKSAPLITCLQILQMAVGSAVTFRSGVLKSRLGDQCHTDPANVKLGLGMYTAYFTLFTALFVDKYFSNGDRGGEKGGRRGSGDEMGADKVATLCGVPLTKDGAGFFQPDQDEVKDNAPAHTSRKAKRTKKNE